MQVPWEKIETAIEERLFPIIILATFLALILAIILFVSNRNDLLEETYQFVLVVAFGGLLSLAYNEFQRRKENKADKSQQKRDEAAKKLQ
jgi:hypothetical protein